MFSKEERKKRVERTRQWRLKNPERHREHVKQWRKRYPEKAREKDLRYQKAHPEEVKKWRKTAHKNYYEKNRKKEIARTSKWRKDNWAWWQMYYKKNKKKIAATSRKSEYGITAEQYEAKLRKQKGLCKICKRKMKRPDVDHNHLTGQIRDLLCRKCNVILGMAGESVRVLQRAIQYVRRHNGLEYKSGI